MKRKLKAVTAAIISVIVCLTLASCSGNNQGSEQNGSDSAVSASASTAAYQAKISYYEELIDDLNQRILTLREEKYISDAEARIRISQLEKEISALRDGQYISVGTDNVTDQSENNSQKTDFLFTKTTRGISIDSYVGSGKNIVIPSEIDGTPVTSISDNAFSGKAVTSVVIPDSVTTIGWFAFYCCSYLDSVSIPASVNTIGYGCFDGCPSALVIHAPADSYAAAFASSYAIRHCE